MNENILSRDLRLFHSKFGLHYDGPPRFLPEELSKLRIVQLHEEVNEYEDAVKNKDLHGQFDALIDMIYFAVGTIGVHGFPFQEGWDRVQAANMAKVRATCAADSKRGSASDVVKPPGWTPPDLSDLICTPQHPSRADCL